MKTQFFRLLEEKYLFPFSLPAYFLHHWNKSALLLHSSFAVLLDHLQVPRLPLHLPLTSHIHNLTWAPLLASLLTIHSPSFKAPSFLSCYRSLCAGPIPIPSTPFSPFIFSLTLFLPLLLLSGHFPPILSVKPHELFTCASQWGILLHSLTV